MEHVFEGVVERYGRHADHVGVAPVADYAAFAEAFKDLAAPVG